MREIKKIAIAGAGTMGASMAETFAKFGYEVVCYDIFEAALEKAKNLISINQETEQEHGIVTAEESKALMDRIILGIIWGCMIGFILLESFIP